MLWNEQRNQLTSLLSSLSEENADTASIVQDMTNLLNENPDELSSLQKTQNDLNTANTRLEEVRKTNRDLLSRISATAHQDINNSEKKVTIDSILEGVL